MLLNTTFWGLAVLCLIILILPLLGINASSKQWQIYEDVLFFLAILFLLYTSIRFLFAPMIILKRDYIYKCGDGLPKFEKIQYKCSIKYTDIKNISIIASANDSKNKRIQLKWISSSVPKKYLEFEQINSNKKIRMCINYYTKKQIIKMLNYINNNMQQSGNENKLDVEAIMKCWFIFDKSTKKS